MTHSPNIPEPIKIQMQMMAYLDRSIGYYIFARKAVVFGVMPVGGSMFHNAVEMLLHCGLSMKYLQKDLRKKFSKHELPEMWQEFKKTLSDTSLNKFDVFINHHRQWKYLRYPKIDAGNSAIFFGPKRPDPLIMKQNMKQLQGSTHIEINLEDIDEFMSAVIKAIRINPDNIKITLQRNKELMNLYLDNNSYALFDEIPITNSSTFLLHKA